MVSRLFKVLSRQVRGLHEAAYVLAAFSLLSHLLALLRDRLFAHYFGAGAELDMYYAAFRIPDFIFVSIASMVSLFVLIPFLLDRMDTKAHVREFIDTVFSAFFYGILAISAVAFIFAPSLVSFLFPGFTEAGVQETVVVLSRIMLLSPIFLGISNIFASITQLSERFFVYAVTPVLYNFGIVLGIVLLYPIFGLPGLAIGVVAGALFHMLIQVPAVAQEGLFPRLSLRINLYEVGRLVLVSLPRTLALSANQLVLLVLVAIASTMQEGSISVFTFAFNIQSVPLSIVAASYSVAAFPTLAKFFSSGAHKEFFQQMTVAARHIIFWSVPLAVLFIVLRAQIVRVALGSGAFTWTDTRLTAALLGLFVISLVAQGLEMLFIRGYYAAGQTTKPLVVKVLSSVGIILFAFGSVAFFESSIFFSSFMESLFRIADVPGSTVLMLALAYSVGVSISAFVFWVLFHRDFGELFPAGLRRTLLEGFSAGVFAGAAAYTGLIIGAAIFNLNTFFGVLAQGFIGGVAGVLVGMVVLKALNSPEFEETWRAFHKKFWKAKPIGADIEELTS